MMKRGILQSCLLAGTLMCLFFPVFSQTSANSKAENNISKTDSLKLELLWQMAKQNNWSNQSAAMLNKMVAQQFLGTAYKAGMLDENETETLVINLEQLDCVTFVEYSMVVTLCIKNGTLSNHAFSHTLKTIRYYDGVLDGYASRLHYFSGWLWNNRQKKLLSLVSDAYANAPLNTPVNILSKNRNSNPHLTDSLTFVRMVETEQTLSALPLRYITKNSIKAKAQFIKDGDIIAITTSINGLDIAHVGIAIHQNGQLKMIHASSTEKQVVITPNSLFDYLNTKSTFTGIIVGRLN